MSVCFESLPLCLRLECFRYLTVHDLGVFGTASTESSRLTVVDAVWKELYPSTFTRAREAIPEEIQNLVNRPYRRNCIGWSVSVLQVSSSLWLTGVVMDYRNELFLVKYDLDGSQIWEKETSTSGPWFTAGKLRLRFLSAPRTNEKRPLPRDFEETISFVPKPRNHLRVIHDDCDSVSGDSTVADSFSLSIPPSPLGSPTACICGDATAHSWRCEMYRDRIRAPTKLFARLEGHSDEVLSVAFSNAGDRLASCSRDGTSRISFTPSAVAPPVVIQHERGDVPCRVVWSPDDSLILACTEAKNGNIFDYDAQVSCFDSETGARLFSRPNIPFDVCAQWIPNTRIFIHGESLTISPRGTYHQSLALFDCDTNQVVGRFHFRFISEAFIHLIQVSPDGQFLAVTCGIGDALSDTVRIVRIPTAASFEIRVPRAKFDASTLLASATTPIELAPGLVASTPVAKLLAIAEPCSDGDIVVPSFYCAGAVLGLAWSKNSRTFYTNTRVYVHSTERLTERPDLDNTLEIQAWNIADECGSPFRRMKGAHGFTTKDCPFYLFLAESPCGEYIASGSEDCGVYLYHIRHGRLLRVLWNGHSDVVSMVSWKPNINGCLLASASDDHSVCLWSGSSEENHQVIGMTKRLRLTS